MSEAAETAAMEHSTFRLYAHVLQKGFQAGGVVGLGLVVPIMIYRRRKTRMQAANAAFLQTALRTVGKSAAYGAIGTGGTAQYVKCQKLRRHRLRACPAAG